MTPRKRITPKKQRKAEEVLEFMRHFNSTPLWVQGDFEPTRDNWPKADVLTAELPDETRVSWINPSGYEVRTTWSHIKDRLGLYSDLRIHPYDIDLKEKS